MIPRRRDGAKAWSNWEHYVRASLAPDQVRRLAGIPPRSRAQIARIRRSNALSTLPLIALIVALMFVGSRFRDIAIMTIVLLGLLGLALIQALRPEPNWRLLVRLRRGRVSVARSLTAPARAEDGFAQVRSRRSRAAAQLSRNEGCLRLFVVAHAHPAATNLVAFGSLVIWVGQMLQSPALQGLPPWLALVAWATSGGLLLAAIIRVRTERRRLLAGAQGSACPDCGFPLADVRPAPTALPERSAEVGPAVCPECGCPWPLVPPEFPSDDRPPSVGDGGTPSTPTVHARR